MNVLVGISVLVIGLSLIFCDAVDDTVDFPDNQHDTHGIHRNMLHEAAWEDDLHQNTPHVKHDVEYGFKRGHGHENMRGDFEVDNLECPTKCTADIKPVCGSDGNTYNNECLLDTVACKSKLYIYVAKQGMC